MFFKAYVILLVSIVLFALPSSAQTTIDDLEPLIWIKSDSVHPGSFQSIDHRQNGYFIQWNQSLSDTALNFHKVVVLDSNNAATNQLNFLPQANTGAYTVYSVYKSTLNKRSNIYAIRTDSTKYNRLTTNSIRSGNKEIFYSDSIYSLKTLINKSIFSWKDKAIDSTVASFSLFGNDSLPYSGYFGELIIMDTTLERQGNEKIHTYLAIQYGITLKTINYRASDDSIIWNTEKNKDYSHEIGGIGRDDSLSLNQKQSRGNGGDSELTISLGPLKQLNQENPSVIADRNYMLWGHNGLQLEINQDTVAADVYHNILRRIWQMRLYGDSAHLLNPVLAFEADSLGLGNQNTVYLIQHPDTSRFDTSQSVKYLPDSVMGNTYYFSNINWDQDSSGMDYFSFQTDSITSMFYNLTDTTIHQINDHNPLIDYQVFPNPSSSGKFRVWCRSSKSIRIRIAIYDSQGKLIQQSAPESGKFIQELFSISRPGVYLIRIQSKYETRSFKIMITL